MEVDGVLIGSVGSKFLDVFPWDIPFSDLISDLELEASTWVQYLNGARHWDLARSGKVHTEGGIQAY